MEDGDAEAAGAAGGPASRHQYEADVCDQLQTVRSLPTDSAGQGRQLQPAGRSRMEKYPHFVGSQGRHESIRSGAPIQHPKLLSTREFLESALPKVQPRERSQRKSWVSAAASTSTASVAASTAPAQFFSQTDDLCSGPSSLLSSCEQVRAPTHTQALSGDVSAQIKDRIRKKDPNAPKKAKTSYIFFCTEMRDQVRKDFPGMKVPEVGKELGRRWNSLEATERLKFEQMAAEDRKRVAGEVEKYEESIVRAQKEVKVSAKNENDESNEAPEKSKAAEADITDAEDTGIEAGDVSHDTISSGDSSLCMLSPEDFSQNMLSAADTSQNMLSAADTSLNMLSAADTSQNMLSAGDTSQNMLSLGDISQNMFSLGDISPNMLSQGDSAFNCDVLETQ